MHTNGSSISLHFVFQLVARLDSQGLSNLLWNGRLALLVTVECSIVISLPFERVLTHLLSLTFYGLQMPACPACAAIPQP